MRAPAASDKKPACQRAKKTPSFGYPQPLGSPRTDLLNTIKAEATLETVVRS